MICLNRMSHIYCLNKIDFSIKDGILVTAVMIIDNQFNSGRSDERIQMNFELYNYIFRNRSPNAVPVPQWKTDHPFYFLLGSIRCGGSTKF